MDMLDNAWVVFADCPRLEMFLEKTSMFFERWTIRHPRKNEIEAHPRRVSESLSHIFGTENLQFSLHRSDWTR